MTVNTLDQYKAHNICSRKYYDHVEQMWKPMFMVEGISAYKAAVLHGWKGDEAEFYNALAEAPQLFGKIDDLEVWAEDLVVDNLETNDANKALSASQGIELKRMIEEKDYLVWASF